MAIAHKSCSVCIVYVMLLAWRPAMATANGQQLFGGASSSQPDLAFEVTDQPASGAQGNQSDDHLDREEAAELDATCDEPCECPPGLCCLGDPWTLFGSSDEESNLSAGGWFSSGYHSESNELFNSHPDRFNLHQGWLYFEKVAESGENGELDWGFRFDGMYGVDGPDTQAFANPLPTWDLAPGFTRGGGYGWAIPQLYGEFAWGPWSVKVGHFYTLIGYEVVTAPDNFFYSHAITMYNSEPFTHTGAIASREISDRTTIYAGWTAGWDTGFDFSSGSSFLGGISTTIGEDVSFTWMVTAGDFGVLRGDDGYMQSIVIDVPFGENLSYVFQSDLLRVDSTGEDNFGINQYLFYTVNECLSLGARVEWWKGDVLTGYAPHGGVLPVAGSLSYYEATVGMNWKISPNLIARPELRYDWSPAGGYDQGIFGVDFVATF